MFIHQWFLWHHYAIILARILKPESATSLLPGIPLCILNFPKTKTVIIFRVQESFSLDTDAAAGAAAGAAVTAAASAAALVFATVFSVVATVAAAEAAAVAAAPAAAPAAASVPES